MIHVFTLRHIPPGRIVETWVETYAPGAALNYGGGLRVVIEDEPLAFHFKVAWAGFTSFHGQFEFLPDQDTDPHAF